MIYWLLVPVLLSISGCSEAPLPKFMAPEAAASIQIGRSTMTDVQQAFGRLQRVRTVQDKDSTTTIWWYQHVDRGTFRDSPSEPEKLTIVEVHFSPDQVVRKIERTYQEIHSPEERGVLVPY
jgi:hypothetical protein